MQYQDEGINHMKEETRFTWKKLQPPFTNESILKVWFLEYSALLRRRSKFKKWTSSYFSINMKQPSIFTFVLFFFSSRNFQFISLYGLRILNKKTKLIILMKKSQVWLLATWKPILKNQGWVERKVCFLYPGSQQPGKTVDKSLKTVSEVLDQIEEFLRGERRFPRNREKSVFFSQR